MDRADYLRHVRNDGTSLAQAAASAPDAPVPSCPDWDMGALVGHVARVHHWVAEILRTATQERPTRRFTDEIPEAFVDRLAWFGSGLDELIAELASVDLDVPVWNWGSNAPGPASWWVRRMAQETVVHRCDAEFAAGIAPPAIDAALAVDGIDEFLGFVGPQLAARPVEGLGGVLTVAPADAGGPRTIRLRPDGIDCSPGGPARSEGLSGPHDEAGDRVVAPASDLYLWLLGRPGPVTVEGAGDAARAWRRIEFD